MKTSKSSSKSSNVICGGVDVGKAFLDVAVESGGARREHNTREGRAAVCAFFAAEGVTRVGLEASGGYEIEIAADLRAVRVPVRADRRTPPQA